EPTADLYLRMDDTGRVQLDGLCRQQLEQETTCATALLNDLKQVTGALAEVERSLAAIPDAEAIARLISERDAARQQRDDLAEQAGQAESAVVAVSAGLQEAERELNDLNDRLREANLANEEADRFVRDSDRARETLERFRVALTIRHADRLGR